MAWWGTDLGGKKNANFKDPKRKHRFLVKFGSAGFLLSTKSIHKPTATFENREYKMINHRFSYPGLVKWGAVELSLVDFNSFGTTGRNSPLGYDSESTSTRLWDMLLATGYSTPSGKRNAKVNSDGISSPSKELTGKAFGEVCIYQIDEGELQNGKSVINYLEKWTLVNPIIERISWGDLSYSEEDLVQCDMTIKFDWPEYEPGPKLLKFS